MVSTITRVIASQDLLEIAVRQVDFFLDDYFLFFLCLISFWAWVLTDLLCLCYWTLLFIEIWMGLTDNWKMAKNKITGKYPKI